MVSKMRVQGQSFITEEAIAEMYVSASNTSLMFMNVALTNIQWYDTHQNLEIPNNDEAGLFTDDFLNFYIYMDKMRDIKAEYPQLFFHDIITSLAFDTYLTQHPENIDIAANITIKDVWIEEVH